MGQPVISDGPEAEAFIKALGLNTTGLCSVKMIMEHGQLAMIEAVYEVQDTALNDVTYRLRNYMLVEIANGDPGEQGQAEDQGVVPGQSARPLPDQP